MQSRRCAADHRRCQEPDRRGSPTRAPPLAPVHAQSALQRRKKKEKKKKNTHRQSSTASILPYPVHPLHLRLLHRHPPACSKASGRRQGCRSTRPSGGECGRPNGDKRRGRAGNGSAKGKSAMLLKIGARAGQPRMAQDERFGRTKRHAVRGGRCSYVSLDKNSPPRSKSSCFRPPLLQRPNRCLDGTMKRKHATQPVITLFHESCSPKSHFPG